jgi:hypothetical protein
MLKYLALLFSLTFTTCSIFEKDNKIIDKRNPISAELKAKQKLYSELVKNNLDSYGVVILGHSKGDSLLYSSLARVSGAVDFDPSLFITPEGRPVRHPSIHLNLADWENTQCNFNPPAGKSSCTSISKDMVTGLLLMLLDYGKEAKAEALQLITKVINYGRANKSDLGGWEFCTKEEKVKYKINDEDWLGRCTMSLTIIKDVYLVAEKLGYKCDEQCQVSKILGPSLPVDNEGFERHLTVIVALRNGLVEGGVNDVTLKALEKAANSQPRNSLYQAVYQTFASGDFSLAIKGLEDERLFPKDSLPTVDNYCTEYLFARDSYEEVKLTANSTGSIEYTAADGTKVVEGGINPGEIVTRVAQDKDWSPCPGREDLNVGKGVDWLFALAVIIGL